MSGFRVLDAHDPAQRAAWVHLWEDSPMRLPHAHPALTEPQLDPGDRLVAAVLDGGEPGGTVLHVLIVRPVPGAAESADRHVDLVSPHGYAGPLVWGASDVHALARLFWQAFDAWARAAHAVTEFVRLSLDDDVLPSPGTVTPRLINYVAQLPATAQELWDSYAPKVRQNARHAQRAGVTIEIDTTGDRLPEFLAIHESTMERRGSEDRYRVCGETLRGVHEQMPGGFAYVFAMSAGRAVSVDFVLLGARTAYYHLGGTEAEAFGLRPNDLVKAAAMEYARCAGCIRFVLGGGLHDGDGLERYKKGFAPRGAQDFCTTERILDPAAHGSLVRDLESRMSAARATGGSPDWVDGPDFFPAYRRRFTVPARLDPAGTSDAAESQAAVAPTGTALTHEHALAHEKETAR
jgi:hypothetical protein